MSNRLKFFRVAIKSLKTSGTITPSSRFLVKKMLSNIDFSSANVLVELGPGNGAITRKILKNLHKEAILVCFEINDTFYRQLQLIDHPQLIVLNVSAEYVMEELEKLGHKNSNHIISSLPLTNIPDKVSEKILQDAFTLLKTDGTFIQYQYTLTYFKKLKKVFRESISLSFEILNIPPAFIYTCKKAL